MSRGDLVLAAPVWLLLPVGLQRHDGSRNIIPTALHGDRAG